MRPEILKLYLVTDPELSLGRSVTEVVKEAIQGGVTIVQLREKNASIKEFYAKALELKKILAGTGIPLIINDRIDIALAIDADGVHLGQSDMPYRIARKLLGNKKIIGISCPEDSLLIEANDLDVDYVAVQAYPTQTKANATHPRGIEGLKHSRMLSKKPLVAIGGIHLSNATEIASTKVDGLAVVSEIMSARFPKEAAIKLNQAIDTGRI